MVKTYYRQSLRLKHYDYASEGMYFVTICAQDHRCVFGDVKEGNMKLSDLGAVVQETWAELSERFHHIELVEFVVMPNHVHGIGAIVGAGLPRPSGNILSGSNAQMGAETAPLRAGSLGQMVAYFKYQSTKRINRILNMPGRKLWQRNYYERVIRKEKELLEVRQYILENPLKWDADPENIGLAAGGGHAL